MCTVFKYGYAVRILSEYVSCMWQVQTMEDYWGWLNNTAVPSLRCDDWYNYKRPVGMRGFFDDKVSRIMGYATLRQLRIRKGECRQFMRLAATFCMRVRKWPECTKVSSVHEKATKNLNFQQGNWGIKVWSFVYFSLCLWISSAFGYTSFVT